MPKLADEFKTEKVAPTLGSPTERAPQAVSKPAPMAPRNVAPMAPRNVTPRAPQAAAAPPRRAEPALAPAPNPQSALADKLRAQREAAEKLAAQRVNAARERAENRVTPVVEPKLPAPEPKLPMNRPSNGPAAATAKSTAVPVRSADRPKFSFADEPAPAIFQPRPSANGLQPLVPPRPALGGDRVAPVPPRGAGLGAPGGYRQEPPAYRPIDPATGYPGQSSARGGTGYPPARPYAPGQSQAAGSLAPRRAPGYDAPRQAPDERYAMEEEEVRGDPRLSRSMSARPRPAPPDGDDVFEDQPPPPPQGQRRRASAADYNAAYREAEETFEEPAKRSGGPWLLLLALLLAAVATGAVVWYYQTKIKPVASTSTTSTTSGESVPVVPTPEQPAKTAAETPADQPVDVPNASKKQIYDRIVGDQEVTGDKVVPTEQTPVQPAAQSSGQDGTQLIPAPAGSQGTGGTTEEAVPLPLPPPPGDGGTGTQGSLDKSNVEPAATQVAGSTGNATTGQGSESIASLLPPEGTDGSAAVSKQATPPSGDKPAANAETIPQMESIGGDSAAGTGQAAASSTAADTADTAPPPVEVKKPAVQKKAASKTKTTTKSVQNLGSEPVVLVPPSQDAGDVAAAAPGQDTASVQAPQTSDTQAAAPTQKRKTIFDLFKGKSSGAPAAADQAGQTTQVASAPEATQQTAPATKTKTTGGSGYVAQLASYKTTAEAQSEIARLRTKYPAIVGGLQPNISTATVAGSTRYRLGFGPMASRDEASSVCGSLLASGERDCIVRKQ
jgi:hypothetical protein